MPLLSAGKISLDLMKCQFSRRIMEETWITFILKLRQNNSCIIQQEFQMKIFILFAILTLSIYPALASEPIGKYTVAVDVLNIRDAPNGKVIGKLKKKRLMCMEIKVAGPVSALTVNHQNGFLHLLCGLSIVINLSRLHQNPRIQLI